MGWKRDLDGVWRTEREIKVRNMQATKLGCVLTAVALPLCVVFSFFKKDEASDSDIEKEPPTEIVEALDEEMAELLSGKSVSKSEPAAGAVESEPPAPPTATIRKIAHLINASPDQGTVTLLESFSGTWETTEPISFGGEFGQSRKAGLMWRMSLPEEPAKPASTQYSVQGADEWSRWEQVELDIATVKFEGSEHFYPSIRLSPVLDVAFTAEDEIVFAMVTTPGQEPTMVTMKKATVPETGLPNLFTEAEQEVGEILSVFKEGTLDEAKVIVSRLEATATNFPDAAMVPSLRDHILAVFRAENTFFVTENKVVAAEKRVAELLEKAKTAARQNNDGDALGIAQEALRLAKQEEQQHRESAEGSRQLFKEVLVSAEKFCEAEGGVLNNFETVLHKVRERIEK